MVIGVKDLLRAYAVPAGVVFSAVPQKNRNNQQILTCKQMVTICNIMQNTQFTRTGPLNRLIASTYYKAKKEIVAVTHPLLNKMLPQKIHRTDRWTGYSFLTLLTP